MPSSPDNDKLTPRQQIWFIATLLFIALSFSGVFAYAYLRGEQVHTQRAYLANAQSQNPDIGLQSGERPRPVKPLKIPLPAHIPRGQSGPPTFLALLATQGQWRWIVRESRTGAVYAKDTFPNGLVVNTTTSHLHAPTHMPPGRYFLSIMNPIHKQDATSTCANYEFEVV